jgi:hypothetical protein
MTNKIKYLLAKATLLITTVFICVVAYWLLYPYKLLEIKNNPVPISATTVEGGEYISYTLDFCRFTDLPATVTRQFIDGVVYTTPTIIVQDTARCGSRETLVRVPPTLLPDTYHMHIIIQIKVNPIRTMTYRFETQPFEITNKHADEVDDQILRNTKNIKENTKDIEKID